MRYRKLDANGDYSFGHQQADFYVNTPEAVAQACETRLRLYAGEWFLDTTAGMPWRTQVLGKYTKNVYDAVIKSYIASTPGVNSVNNYSSSLVTGTRQLSISATLDTAYGQIPLSTTL